MPLEMYLMLRFSLAAMSGALKALEQNEKDNF